MDEKSKYDIRLEKQINYLNERSKINKSYLRFAGNKKTTIKLTEEIETLEDIIEDLKEFKKLKQMYLKVVKDLEISDSKTAKEIKRISVKL